MARLTRSPEGFEEWLAESPRVTQGVRSIAYDLRDEVEREIALQAYDTGRLMRAVTVEEGRAKLFGRKMIAVRSNAGQGEPAMLPRWLNHGTGIYGPRKKPIRPVRAKYLRFKPKGSGVYVYRKSVRGIKPRTYMADAAATIGERRGLSFRGRV